MSGGTELRRILAAPGCAIAAGAYDPAAAKLVELAGLPVVYVSGSGSSTAVGGFPDVGLLTFSEMLDNARHVINATSTPTLCDVDTGAVTHLTPHDEPAEYVTPVFRGDELVWVPGLGIDCRYRVSGKHAGWVPEWRVTC